MGAALDWVRAKRNPAGYDSASPRSPVHAGHANGGRVKRFTRDEIESMAAKRGVEVSPLAGLRRVPLSPEQLERNAELAVIALRALLSQLSPSPTWRKELATMVADALNAVGRRYADPGLWTEGWELVAFARRPPDGHRVAED